MNLAAAILGLAVAGAAAAGPSTTTLYKSVGPDGRTVYSDRPPADRQTARTLTFENQPSSPLSAATLAYIEQLQKSSAAPVAAPAPAGVVLYTTAWCGYCRKARAYLASQRIAYRDVDIETPGGLVAYVQAGGRKGVPLLVSGAGRVAGFSTTAYDALLLAKR